jgi:hypothetical protein
LNTSGALYKCGEEERRSWTDGGGRGQTEEVVDRRRRSARNGCADRQDVGAVPGWIEADVALREAAACVRALLDRNNLGYRDQAESERFHADLQRAADALAALANTWGCPGW